MMPSNLELADDLDQAIKLFNRMRKNEKLTENERAIIYLAMSAAMDRLNPPVAADGHPWTSFDGPYKELGNGKKMRADFASVVLSQPDGFEVRIALDEMDDQAELAIHVIAPRTVMFRINGYDYGYRSADGMMYSADEKADDEDKG